MLGCEWVTVLLRRRLSRVRHLVLLALLGSGMLRLFGGPIVGQPCVVRTENVKTCGLLVIRSVALLLRRMLRLMISIWAVRCVVSMRCVVMMELPNM